MKKVSGIKKTLCMKKRGLLVNIALCLFILIPVRARAQADGIIQGQVINGTAGGGTTAGLEVELHVFQGQVEGDSLTTTTDGEGKFRVEGLETGSDWLYLARTVYQGVTYPAGLAAFEPGTSELNVDVLVYEATTDYVGIEVERAHLFVTVLANSLSVSELHIFTNRTDRSYVGADEIDGQRWVSQFLLPQDSHDLAFEDGTLGGRFISVRDGFVDREPLWPGQTSVMFSYVVDCGASGCDLSREISHPISNLNVLISDVDVKVESKNLTFAGTGNTEGQQYLNYTGANLKSGDQLDLRIQLAGTAVTGSAAVRGGSSTLPWILLGAVLASLALIYPFWKQRVRDAAIKEARQPARKEHDKQ